MGVSEAVLLVKVSVAWLLGTMESLLQGDVPKDFMKSSKVGNKVFITKRSFNSLAITSIWLW
jgi:hypothetical protein